MMSSPPSEAQNTTKKSTLLVPTTRAGNVHSLLLVVQLRVAFFDIPDNGLAKPVRELLRSGTTDSGIHT